ncbi:hypothetical protein BGZ90_005884 [Linnemannia elongata]|nr:hypothetical protein BGZ90_005884 [Linnemannia elongata]
MRRRRLSTASTSSKRGAGSSNNLRSQKAPNTPHHTRRFTTLISDQEPDTTRWTGSRRTVTTACSYQSPFRSPEKGVTESVQSAAAVVFKAYDGSYNIYNANDYYDHETEGPPPRYENSDLFNNPASITHNGRTALYSENTAKYF